MNAAMLCLIVFLALIAWRFAFTAPRRRPLLRAITARQEQQGNGLEPDLHVLGLAERAVIPDNPAANGSDCVHPITLKDRGKTYLCRIVALTGATQIGTDYVLDVGTTRFHVRDKYVRRMRDATDPKCMYEETCFYSTHKEIPKSERIASALLQLRNNPALFDRWAAQSGAFKANGQAFCPA